MTSVDLTCRELVERIGDHLEGSLPARERIRLEQHLVVCEGCAGYADQLRTTIQLVRTTSSTGSHPRASGRCSVA